MAFRCYCHSVRIKEFASFSARLCHFYIVHCPVFEMSGKHDILKLNVFTSLAVAWYAARHGLLFILEGSGSKSALSSA